MLPRRTRLEDWRPVGSAAERAYLSVREGILTGRYDPGEALREEVLAESIGVSRTPVREALHRLVAEGFLESAPNRGVTVASWDADDIRETFELRAMLEGYAVSLAAERATPERVARLSELCDVMENKFDQFGRHAIDEIAQLNIDYHSFLLGLADHRRLESLLSGLIELHIGYQTFRHYSDVSIKRSFVHHREIIAAISARDGGWAESVMRAHVLSAREALVPTAVDD